MSYSETNSDGDRMFSPVYHDVWQQQLKHMKASDFKVYFALLAHTTQKDRTWFMSITELAEDAGVVPSTASAAKDRLIKAGLIGQSWRYRDENGDYHLNDTRPPPRLQAKNVYTVSVRPGNVGAENRDQSGPDSLRKSEPIDTENRNLVDTENRKQTVAPSPEPRTVAPSPLTPQGEDADASESEPAPNPKKRTRHEYTPEFEAFWKMWPNHRGTSKFETSKKFTRALKAADAETILEGARRFADDPNLDVNYCPAPTTWLNNRRWEAAPLPPRNPSPSRRGSTNGFDDWWGDTNPAAQLPWGNDTLGNVTIINHEEDYQ